MGLMDILQQYAARPTSTEADFDEVAPQLSPDELGDGIAHAFRSEQTPAFGAMVQQLFGGSNPAQRAGLLNQLIGTLGPALLAKVAGGLFGDKLGSAAATRVPGFDATPALTTAEAERITPDQVREIAEQAEQTDPSVLDRIGSFYGKNPELVKMLGGAALAIALGRIAQRRR